MMNYHTFFRNVALKFPYVGRVIREKEILKNQLKETEKERKDLQIEYDKEINKYEKLEQQRLVEIKTLNLKIDEFNLEKENRKYQKACYSQDGEDVVLDSFYEGERDKKGFYVDIGAFHPLRFSNTQIFYERGWRGINIDATPGSMDAFNEVRPRDINIESGIAVDDSELVFYQFEESALNSFNKEISDNRIEKGWKLLCEKKIKTESINSILERNLPKNITIDFINIDVEGLDIEVLRSLDWDKYSPNYIFVEDLEVSGKDMAGYEDSVIYKYLRKYAYGLVGKTKRTLLFKRMYNT